VWAWSHAHTHYLELDELFTPSISFVLLPKLQLGKQLNELPYCDAVPEVKADKRVVIRLIQALTTFSASPHFH